MVLTPICRGQENSKRLHYSVNVFKEKCLSFSLGRLWSSYNEIVCKLFILREVLLNKPLKDKVTKILFIFVRLIFNHMVI